MQGLYFVGSVRGFSYCRYWVHFIVFGYCLDIWGLVWFQWVVCVYFLSIVLVLVSSGLCFCSLWCFLFIQCDGQGLMFGRFSVLPAVRGDRSVLF